MQNQQDRADKNLPDYRVVTGEMAVIYGLEGRDAHLNGQAVFIEGNYNPEMLICILDDSAFGKIFVPRRFLMLLDIDDYMTISSYAAQ